jgi:type IV pilus assembly protein PilY1
VNGRSLSIVRIDTGEILRVFARLGDVPAGDTLRMASPTRIIDTPLDSPMTGTPIVYPADVGGIATKVFAGDADGTIWRFDLSSTDPSKWRGQIFLDLYNNTADKAPTTNWADGQPFDVVPVLSTTSTGEVVLNVASGAIETFDSNGKYYIYSITEKVQGTASTANDSDDPTPTGPKLRAFVNWWLGPSSTPVALRAGERVSGPMTVFDKVLYFATYFAGDPKALSCTNGSARLWGFDYVTPLDTTNCPADSTTCGQGGARRFPPTAPTDFVDPTAAAYGVAQAAVIPGVSIRASPACASLGSSTSSYVGGAHVSTSNFSSGTYSLFATVGASGGNRAGPPLDIQLPTPASPTLIDSWAAVLE